VVRAQRPAGGQLAQVRGDPPGLLIRRVGPQVAGRRHQIRATAWGLGRTGDQAEVDQAGHAGARQGALQPIRDHRQTEREGRDHRRQLALALHLEVPPRRKGVVAVQGCGCLRTQQLLDAVHGVAHLAQVGTQLRDQPAVELRDVGAGVWRGHGPGH
jgi:hypothetical protein